MKIIEIFGSIDGEGKKTGELATFVRIAGCNLRCSYCDTEYALSAAQGEKCSVDDVVHQVSKIGYRNVTITGGEPLIHEETFELIEKLTQEGFLINVETNGSTDIKPLLSNKSVTITMDNKTPSSKESGKMLLENIQLLRSGDVLKFVVAEKDFSHVEEILRKYEPKAYVYISPIFGEIEPNRIVAFMKDLNSKGINTDKIRVQVQLHKIIWKPTERGV